MGRTVKEEDESSRLNIVARLLPFLTNISVLLPSGRSLMLVFEYIIAIVFILLLFLFESALPSILRTFSFFLLFLAIFIITTFDLI